jgi:hypothetical protein
MEPLQESQGVGFELNVTVIGGLTIRFAKVLATHPEPSVTVNVYVIGIAGQTIGFAIVVLDKFIAGTQE